MSPIRKWFIEKLGGYATAQDAILAAGGFLTVEDAITHIRNMDLKERDVLLTLAVKKLFNTIDANDILKPAPGGEWMFMGKTMNKTQAEMLMAEAHTFTNSKLWEVLQADVLYQANKKMYISSDKVMDLVAGKLWRFTFDVMKTRLKSMAKGSPLFNSDQKKR